jgi:hypothetical protein
MTAKIFATELEDWPALERAMRETGEEFRQSKNKNAQSVAKSTSPSDGGGEQ